MPRSPLRLSTAALLVLSLLSTLCVVAPARAATLYAVGGNAGPSGGLSGLYTMNPATGVMTWVGGLHTAGSTDNTIYNGGLAYDPWTDRMYALGCDSTAASALFLIDRTNASMLRLGACYPANAGAFCSGGLAFDVTTRRLFAVGDLGQPPYQRTSLVELDTATGAATPIGDNGLAGTYLAGLGCDPQTGTLYGNGFIGFNQQSALFMLDKGTGTATLVGSHGLSLGRQMNYSGLAVHPSTGVMLAFGSFSASESHLYSVSKSSGAATSIAPESPNGVGVDGGLTWVGIDVLDAGPARVAATALRTWPCPARGPVSITFALAHDEPVALTVFDVTGRRVVTLSDGPRTAGWHEVRWDGADAHGQRVAAGLYFVALRAGGIVRGRASVLIAR